jgi:hypothetical protein
LVLRTQLARRVLVKSVGAGVDKHDGPFVLRTKDFEAPLAPVPETDTDAELAEGNDESDEEISEEEVVAESQK